MAKLTWSRNAILDMERLYLFLERVNPDAAARASAAILNGLETLEQFPESGKPVEGAGPEYRDWMIAYGKNGYVVRYHFSGNEIVIALVRHQRELPW